MSRVQFGGWACVNPLLITVAATVKLTGMDKLRCLSAQDRRNNANAKTVCYGCH
jgi:hypothetical protein